MAVSGGPDSMALLEALDLLAREYHLEIFVAHFDHRLRASSLEEALFVKKQAEKKGFPFILGTAPVKAYARREGLSLETAGRELRYRFFRTVAEKLALDKVALAHQADDLAEEVLLRFIRGAGRRGLAGIPVKREGLFIRPLLLVSREEIEAFLQEREIPFLEDPSNQDPRFLRNRVRHLLIPFLEKHFHKRVREALKRTALVVAEEEEFLGELAERELKRLSRKEAGGLALSVKGLKNLPLALRRRVFLEAFRLVGLPLFRIKMSHLEQMESLLEGRSRGNLNLPSGFIARREPGRLVIKEETPLPPPFFLRVEGPGEYHLPDGRTLFIRLAPPDEAPSEALLLDPQKASFPLLVRPAQAGDRIRPPGFRGRKKLKKLFWEKKIPHEFRWSWPIIEKDGEIVALPGFFAQDGYEWKGGEKALIIELSPLPK